MKGEMNKFYYFITALLLQNKGISLRNLYQLPLSPVKKTAFYK